MKWEPGIGYPVGLWQKQAATPATESVPVEHLAVRPDIMELSDNILLAHYQRERR